MELSFVIISILEDKLWIELRDSSLILKPSLVGGFSGTKEWIDVAEENNVEWWITSALESNIGLNAIAQFTYILDSKLPQGLGTGSLFNNNFSSPLEVNKGSLIYNNSLNWDFKL